MWVATERAVLPRHRVRAVRRRRLRVVAPVRSRADACRHLARPVGATRSTPGYQIVQALYGLTDGGMAGTGLGLGSPGQVPEAQNDFIFTAIGEEMGLFGASAVLISYLLLIGAGLRTALRTDNTFEKLLAVGLTTILGVQAFIIVGGVIKLVPLTGITLPFVSYGGSSLVSNYILLALLIRLSDSGARRLHELPDDPTPSERWAAWRLRRRTEAETVSRECRLDTCRERASASERAASRGLRGRGTPCEPATDPSARRRIDGLLRRPVRRPQLLAGRPPRGAQRPLRQHQGDPPRVQPAAWPDHHDRWRDRRGIDAQSARERVHVPAHLSDRRPLRPRHRLLHVRLRVDRPGAHAERRAHRQHARAGAACPAGHRHR